MTPTDDESELKRIQTWMQAVITHPKGIADGVASAEARDQLEVAADELEDVITRSSKQSAGERLAVYSNAYFARLLGCMEEEFPATKQAVGDEAFARFAVGYLVKYPSNSYSLGDLHRKFPTFLAESRPSAKDDQASQPNWVDFVIDLATLESTYCDVFNGPGEEQLSLLSPESLAQLAPETWMNAKLKVAQSLRLMHFQFPVQLYASAVRKGESARMPPPSETWLAVHRRDYIVRRRPLTLRQYRLLGALQGGKTVADAIEHSLEGATEGDSINENSLDALSRQMQVDFREWAIEGYFRAVEQSME